MVLAGHSQILSCSCGENSGEGLRSCYVTGRKLWTWLVRTESTLRTTRKWPGDKATYSPRTEDHIQVATHLMMNSTRDGILCLNRSNEVTWNDLCTCEEVWEYKQLGFYYSSIHISGKSLFSHPDESVGKRHVGH